jgi:PAS domain S-box-containing protein
MTTEQEIEVGRCIFREANDAFLLIRPADLRVLDANPAAQRLMGLRRKQVLALSLPDLLEADPPHDLEELASACRTTGYFAPADGFFLKTAARERRAVQVSASRAHTEPGPLGLIIVRDVSRQRQAEAALRESEGRLRLALEASQMGTWEWAPSTGRMSWSATTERLFRLAEGAFGGTYEAFLALVHPEDRERVRRTVDGALEAGTGIDVEFRVAGPDGAVRWLAGHGHALGDPGRVLGVVQDVTPRKEAATREGERRFRVLIENSSDAVVVLGADGTVLYATPSVARVRGFCPEDLVGRSAFARAHPDDLARLRESYGQLLRQHGGRLEVKGRLRHKDGSWRWVEGVGTNLLADPLVGGVVVNYRDVTERERAAGALRDSQALYHSLVESLPLALFRKDREGRYTFVNARFCRAVGKAPEEVLGKTDFDLSPPDLAEKYRRDDRLVLETGAGLEGVEQHLAPTGERRTIQVWKTPILNARAEAIEAQGIFWDITEQKRSADALRASEERYRLLFEGNLAGVVLSGADGQVLDCNDSFAALVGHASRAEVLARPMGDFYFRRADRQAVLERLRERPALAGYECCLRRRDGSPAWALASVSVLGAGEGPPSLQEVFIDISERKRAEEERRRLEERSRHAQKLESLGVLAGGIAHDFNNLLTAVLANAGLALRGLPAESPERAAVEQIELAGLRAADLTRQMLAYSGRGRFAVQPVNLSRVVEEMATLLQTVISKKATLRFDFTPGLPAVEADPTQARQVALNLITNASDALGEGGGVITLRTGALQAGRAYLASAHAREDLPEGPYAYLEVSDTGCGMDEGTLARAFEPFFTTKFIGRGLGLAAVLGIVQGHRGAIKVVSAPGQGSTFRVLFPCSQAVAAPAAPAVPEGGGRGGGGRPGHRRRERRPGGGRPGPGAGGAARPPGGRRPRGGGGVPAARRRGRRRPVGPDHARHGRRGGLPRAAAAAAGRAGAADERLQRAGGGRPLRGRGPGRLRAEAVPGGRPAGGSAPGPGALRSDGTTGACQGDGLADVAGLHRPLQGLAQARPVLGGDGLRTGLHPLVAGQQQRRRRRRRADRRHRPAQPADRRAHGGHADRRRRRGHPDRRQHRLRHR